jgi:hypothetical protein
MNRVGLVVLALVLALAKAARAADTKAVAEVEAHDKAFLTAYENGETKKMKTEIAKAVSLGEKGGLGADPVMADTYVLAAIFDVDGNDNAKAGVRDFVKALKIKPDVAIPKGMATSGVKAALKEAREELGLLPKEGGATAVAGAAKPAEASKEPAKEQAQPKEPAAAKQEKPAEKQEKAESDKQLADAKARDERERQEKQDKKAESDKQLADAKTHAQQLEQQLQKDKTDRERGDKDKQLAAATAHIQQLEQQLQKEKAERAQQLADAKARTQQLEQQLQKDKAERDKQLAERDRQIADRDKQLAELRAQEGKEHESLEKVARDKQVADTQARDAETKRKQAQQDRERLFDGPEMPRSLREALTCAIPDEAPLRTDLYVHCVARPNLKARSIVFYYRTTGSGTSKYFSVPMERTAKGWHAAVVPGVRVVGKVLQYYAEALDGREAVVATNGKGNSPNILMLRPSVPRS